MLGRTPDNVNRLRLNQLSMVDTSSLPPITLNGERFPVDLLDTKRLRFTDGGVEFLDDNGKWYSILHANSNIDIEIQAEQNQIVDGQIIIAGPACFTQASPVPIAWFDTFGKINSSNLWHDRFKPYILGFADADKPNWYAHGLVPEGSDAHEHMFLRQDGSWALPNATISGSVTNNLRSMNDFPSTYVGNMGKLLITGFTGSGAGVMFVEPDTDLIAEATNLYYTDTRVDTRIDTRFSDSSLSDLTLTGTLTANAVVCLSDRDLKSGIRKLRSAAALEMLAGLKPSAFHFKSDPATERYGFVAQEVKETVPPLVSDLNGKLGVNYVDLIAPLVAVVQSQQERLNNLENILAVLLNGNG